MKLFNGWCAVLTIGLLGFAGCKKSQQVPASPIINGVKVDFPKLQRTFVGASPEIQRNVSEAVSGVRYGMYERSLEALDKLVNDSTITEDQKKVVTEMIESVKQLLAKAPPPAPSP